MPTNLIRRLPTRLLATVASTQDRALGAFPGASLEQRLAALRAARRTGRRVLRRRGASAMGVVILAAAAVVALWARPRPLRFVVGQARARGVVGARVEAPAAWPVALDFSDGTQMVLGGSASGRVLSLDPAGAHVILERGSMRATVAHRAPSTWLVAVGPFDVRVKGTRFDAAWDPLRERFTLAMYDGVVTVTGRCLPEPLTSRAGDRIDLPCPSTPTPLPTPSPSPSPSPSPAAASPSLPAAAGVRRASVSAAPVVTGDEAGSRRERLRRDWRARLAGHDAPGALARIEEAGGLADACATAGEDDLMRLGEAARAAGRRAPAVQIYDAVRARFAGGELASVAAFHLGQVAFDQGGTLADARAGFAAYFDERPDGALAQEALGRLLEIEIRAGTPAAETLARRYLARFPNGPHAALGQSIVAR